MSPTAPPAGAHGGGLLPRSPSPGAAMNGVLTADVVRGIWRENPVLIQMLGLCPALAVTNSVPNALAMGGATFFVLCGSSVLVSALRRWVPHEVRISAWILIIATFVTIADLGMAAVAPALHKALGAYIALIVVNCVILGRQEAFASRRPVHRALLDAVGTGAGFAVALTMLGAVREVLGSGTFLGMALFGPRFEPWVVMVLPPGGFLTLGLLLLGLGAIERRRARTPAAPRAGLPSGEGRAGTRAGGPTDHPARPDRKPVGTGGAS